MNSSNPMDSIYYVKLPENYTLSKEAMAIDPAIPLPVQKKDNSEEETINPAELTQEQILSGILTILAYDTSNEHTDYYRDLILKARPGIKLELCEAAILKTKNEDWEIAEEVWLAVQGIDPADRAISLNIAIFYDQRADSFRRLDMNEDANAYDELAFKYYSMALDSDPEIPDAYFNIGFFYLKKRNYIEAKKSFEDYLSMMADADQEKLGENGEYKISRAQEIIDEISAHDLENTKFHKAFEYINNGEEEKALDEIRQFLQDNPLVWNAWFMLGWALRRLGRFAEGKAAFEKAMECDGGTESLDCYNELAICQMETGDFDGAQESLIEALNIDPDSTKIISNLGYLNIKMGNKEEAKKYFQTVLEIDSNDKIAKVELEKLN